MGYHEQLSSDSPLYQALEHANEKECDIMPLDDARVQKALIEEWAKSRRDPESEESAHNELAFAWVDGGMAAKFRAYAEENPGQEVDILDTDALRQLLDEIATEQVH